MQQETSAPVAEEDFGVPSGDGLGALANRRRPPAFQQEVWLLLQLFSKDRKAVSQGPGILGPLGPGTRPQLSVTVDTRIQLATHSPGGLWPTDLGLAPKVESWTLTFIWHSGLAASVAIVAQENQKMGRKYHQKKFEKENHTKVARAVNAYFCYCTVFTVEDWEALIWWMGGCEDVGVAWWIAGWRRMVGGDDLAEDGWR